MRQGKAAMTKFTKKKCSGVSTNIKVKLLHTIALPVVHNGCESWTLRKTDKRNIDAVELRT